MRASERQLTLEESEVKPNRYATTAMQLIALAIAGMLLLNETDIFLVAKGPMRIGTGVSMAVLILTSAVIQVAGLQSRPRTKYVIMGVIIFVSIVIGVTLYVHTVLVAVLPMLIAAQYPSRRIGYQALAGSIACAVLSPLLAYLLDLLGYDFYRYVLTLGNIPGAAELALNSEPTARGAALLALYTSLPNACILVAFYPLLYSVNRHGEERLRNQLQVLHMGQSDALTGLKNRHCFMELLDTPRFTAGCRESVLCLYMDVNGLHRLNNERGHDAGDAMLRSVAEALRRQFGDEDTYRIGGDEFAAMVRDLPPQEADVRGDIIRRELAGQGYTVAIGIEAATVPCSLTPLVRAAEAKMQDDKKAYYRRIREEAAASGGTEAEEERG